MEIIHLILGKANPDRMNGVNKVVFQLASKQANSGRNVAVWGITKETTHNYGDRNFSTVLFQANRNPFLLDENLKKSILEKQGKAVFHLHGGWIPTYYSISRFMAAHHIPFVLTPHGAYNTVAMKRSKWMKKIYFQLFEKALLNRAQRVHAIGESEVEGLHGIYANNKSFLLPYGFEYAQNLVNDEADDSNEFVIGFVGRLDIYTKGLDLLLAAFNRFQRTVPQASLWIIGDSNERHTLEQYILKNNVNKVTLWGSKFGVEKDELMRKMKVFVHPSRNEGLPTAVLEAANLQIPCIVSEATNVGSFVDNYNAGVSIPTENEEVLFRSFKHLYSIHRKNGLKELGRNAQKMVEECFQWDSIVEDFDQLYK